MRFTTRLSIVLNLFAPAALLLYGATAAAAEDQVLEEVIVTATLREQSLLEAPTSVTLLNEPELRLIARQHFEDVLSVIPNLHWAGATSRPRFFQIRGVGEREQWQGAPNPSVGFLIDDIDFSGIGMPATLFDVERVEVLRGPQGMRYGANALAGLIVLRGHEPADELGFETEASIGEYASESVGAVATGPVEALNSSWRVAVQRYRSDGYRRDVFLDRDDTNGYDELTGRAKWHWQAGEGTTVDLTWLHTDLDNGYDGWSIDNTRRSLADRPGKDAQRANGAAARLQTRAGSIGTFTAIAAASTADGEYSYDEDWGNAESWAPYTYDYFYRALSKRRSRSLEARLASDDADEVGKVAWLVGVYTLDIDYRLDESRVGVIIDPDFPEFSGSTDLALASRYDARNIAAFAQLDSRLSERWGWSFGMRAEQRDADYRDSGVENGESSAMAVDGRNSMLGGQASVYYDARPNVRLFSTLSRGYKAGGFNIGRGAALRDRFDPEYLWSLDVGAKGEWLDRRLYADFVAFYMKRTDMQVSTGIQEDGIGGGYIFVTDNAAEGRNSGLEASVRWRATERLEVGGALGLLHTSYYGYRPTGEDVGDREQPHAPQYQLSLNATWRHRLGWLARVDFAAIDDYYFDVPPADQRAAAYSLTHVKAGYESDRWAVYLYGRNVFDEDYVVRGFFFANEPPQWQDKRYTQLGEPQQFGITARWEFR
jgi:iron complex outermembrane receptor protein